jgi:pimeloyl-ACP methyl ester carboxylesterase
MWREQLAGLSSVAKVVAVDLPGFGDSAVPAARSRSMDDLADAVLAVASGLGFARFLLAGLSMGGYVAFAVARKAREKLDGLILLDTRAEPDTPAVRDGRLADADRALHDGTGFFVAKQLPLVTDRPDTAAEAELMMRQVRPETLAATLRGMADRPDSRPLLGGLAVPTLVIGGSTDKITPPESMRALATAIPGADLTIVQGGHLSPMDDPHAVNAAIAGFLSRR